MAAAGRWERLARVLFLDPAVVVAVGPAEELEVVDLAVLHGLEDGDVHGCPF